MTALADRKRALRLQILAELRARTPGELRAAGESVAVHLTRVLDGLAPPGKGGTPPTVALFASLAAEIDTTPLDGILWERGFRRALPTLRDGELLFRELDHTLAITTLPQDRFGIPTPPPDAPEVELATCALVLVPGLAFDSQGARLGRGAGYYDRALRRMRSRDPFPPVLALALDLQRVDSVPRGPDDEPVDGLCTPSGGVQVFAPDRFALRP